jgi:neutral ceramidase
MRLGLIARLAICMGLATGLVLPVVCGAQTAAPQGTLRAGAAKVDITPPLQPMSNGWPETLRDHLYVRAIVLDNGTARAALINADQGGLSDAIWNDASKRIAAELQCPVENILMSAIHTHSDGGGFSRSMTLPGTQPPGAGRGTGQGAGQPAGQGAPPNTPPAAGRGAGPGADSGPSVADAIVKAVQEAKAKLQPAVIGFGTGQVYLNVNRDAVNPQTKLWYQGPNTNAPSDKTMAVVTIKTLAGDPIAVYFNYAMHPINYYLTGIVSADFPGEAAADIEHYYDDKAIAIFTQSASGDQNPLYLQPHGDLTAVERGRKPGGPALGQAPADPNAKPDPAAVEEATANLDAMVKAEGQIISQEILRTMQHTDNFSGDVRIWGGAKSIECPGRTRTDSGREGMQGQFIDGAPVHIRLGMVSVGPIAFNAVNAEVYNEIWLRLKAESPLRDSMMVTLTDGNAGSGYIPNDESFSHNTFQVLGSRLKPGCAEDGIVNGLLGLMSDSMKH